MSPEKVLEGEHQAGLQTSSDSRSSDDSALDISGESALVTEIAADQNLAPEEIQILLQMLRRSPDVFSQFLDELQEDRARALQMFGHYADMAINNADAELSTTADDIAPKYLELALKANSQKKDLLKTLIQASARKYQVTKTTGSNGLQINGDVNLGYASRRGLLKDMRSLVQDKPSKKKDKEHD